MNGPELLASYKSKRSEDAFTELVRRYTNLVYSVAKRHLPDGALAEDATQTVFLRLVKASPKLNADGALVAWLHRTTVHVSVDMWRSETRRRTREQHVAAMEPASAENAPVWAKVAPHLDQALDLLSDEDREVVLLRFFAKKRMRDIGQLLGVTEDAAKMRVSRAVDRLRSQLGSRGVACTVTALACLMAEHSIEAAPGKLVARLLALKSTASGVSSSASLLSHKTSLVFGLVGLVSFMVYLIWPTGEKQDTMRPTAPRAETTPKEPNASRPTTWRSGSVSDDLRSPEPANYRLSLHLVDAETGRDLTSARVHAVYFYAGGVPEGHDLRPDANGVVSIPAPAEAGDHGMNIFVTAEYHVPKCLAWGETAATNYTMKLDPAAVVGGTVVDQEDHAVEGVKIEIQGPGIQGQGPEHVAFNAGNSQAVSDAQGRWICPYVPRAWEAVKLILTRDDYAVTHVSVPMATPESTRSKLIIRRGFTVAGYVTDTNGLPVVGTQVKELHNYGHRVLSTRTDNAGMFLLRGLTNELEPRLNLVFEAAGYAPQVKTVELLDSTNFMNAVMAEGNYFRGRVVDKAGNPIPHAVVRTDSDNQGLIKFRWSIETDVDGRFSWDSAPAEPVLFWFEANGYQVIRDLSLSPDGTEHEIVLTWSDK
jgi:RNA polymerase sigma factor (sigma-70 family)